MATKSEWSTVTLGKKPRSKTGCRTCRIRKVKCDEEKLPVAGQAEPQCRRCAVAQIRCEWHGGPIPRRKPVAPKKSQGADAYDGTHSKTSASSSAISNGRHQRRRSLYAQTTSLALAPLQPARAQDLLQAANSLSLSGVDRYCIEYLRDSALVIILGKHWPWSTLSYAYHRVAVHEPMLMSMILASTASEIHRARCHDSSAAHARAVPDDLSDVDGRRHYGRALAGLREALKQDVKSPARIEAIFITLWLMVDYESRFGNGVSAINIHIRGIVTILHNHIVPLLQNRQRELTSVIGNREIDAHPHGETAPRPQSSQLEELNVKSPGHCTPALTGSPLRRTSVPLFLLWTLYFFTPGAVFHGLNGQAQLESDLFRFFLCGEPGKTSLTLPELYKISRQSPSRFWGEDYPATAQLDDMENLPGLTLYHRSHVVQFNITELFKKSHANKEGAERRVDMPTDSYQHITAELATIADEYDTLLSSAQSAPSVEIVPGRRVMETILWSSITYYSTIVYLYLCFPAPAVNDNSKDQQHHSLLSLSTAVTRVLELALKLHRSRPRLMLRIVWPLFIAGIATPDKIYQDWVSIRLRELAKYGQNYARVSSRFDEVIQGGEIFVQMHPSAAVIEH
ncbi:hypothetical protein BDV59DRAFT_206936 [Aspergillus ambiguus]|uniref:uncharacterized protein n=1 Tax=Aspergillus ambiguus TaxID=176160 RepID=UPI003CCDF47D